VTTVLVTGATGAVGPTLVKHLLASGYSVRTYSRSISPLLPQEVDQRCGDLLDHEAILALMEDISIVFHLAALLHVENPSPKLSADYQRVNVAGTRTVTEAALAAGVKRFIYFSTVKVYGLHQYPPITENQSPAPKTMYAQTKLQGEYEALQAEGLETIVLRLSAVYGPRLRGAWARLIKAVQHGWFIPIGHLSNRRSLTYVEDVARAALFVAEHAQTPGHIYNVVGHSAPTQREIITAIYAASGRTLPSLRIPGSLAQAGASILDTAFKLIGKRSPITRETISQFTENETYSSEALSALGFKPSVSLEEGWRETLELMP
jgi:UDP-glucose 4-epimerase